MKCCPPGRGHNLMGGHQPCHMGCARNSVDREAVAEMESAWARYQGERFWHWRRRAGHLRVFRFWRDRANEAPWRPPARTVLVALAANPVTSRAACG